MFTIEKPIHIDKKQTDTERKHTKFSQQLRDYFTEYCDNSGIHGAKYIGEQNRLIAEKLWWFIALTISLFCCAILIQSIYSKWDNSPVIVSFATTETPIWKIPFPAVTICQQSKSIREIFDYADLIYKKKRKEKLDKEDEIRLSYVYLLCTYDQKLKFNVSKTADDELLDTLHEVAPRFVDKLSGCSFMGRKENCSGLFTPIITDEGLCYSFNILHRKNIFTEIVKHYKNFHAEATNSSEWSLDDGYNKNASLNAYPRRGLYEGALFSLEITIETTDDVLDFACSKTVPGYKVRIHHPFLLPTVKEQYFMLPLDEVVVTTLQPTMITTSNEIRHYSPESRECYFSNERQLKFFKIYTQQNCRIECKTNFTLLMCGCVEYYMPRKNTTKICGAPKRECVLKAAERLVSRKIEKQLRKLKGLPPLKDVAYQTEMRCDCKPDCTSLTYAVETSQAQWEWIHKAKLDGSAALINESITHKSFLRMFFKTTQFITSERNELFGLTDFLANCGGILGLFTGFSFLSLVEVVYYITLRLVSNIKLFGREHWAGNKN